MIKHRYWHGVSSAPILAALPSMTWQRSSEGASPAAETAALMLYVALNFMTEPMKDDFSLSFPMAAASYDDLSQATGLSRSLISQGLQRLIQLKLVMAIGSHQKRRYRILELGDGWFKLPCQAIVSSGVILPFKNFTLRTKFELHAMKLYLYLAARRDNHTVYSMAAYETIYKSIGVPERDIRKAISLLIGCGLLASVDRQHSQERNVNEPNKYFLTGYHQLFNGAAQATAAMTVA